MLTLDPQAGKYGVTARLFSLVSHLPHEQQLLLLRQLAEDKLTEHLFKMIVDLSEQEQMVLLERIGHSPESESPINTVSLENTEPSMRENPRKNCLINANYVIKGRSFRSYILDVSIGGVFIETNDRFATGEAITLNFALPDLTHPFSLHGKIAWSGPRGFGVKFENVPVTQSGAIKQYVEKEE
jgi:Tfp pilus assembly protein PilZ